ncbi:hypothetical protein [Trichocoleus sp. FACHB-262]|uniref:hypothetical protein n=1 Tax=Trichocoleus sp. FACHB-262 TaxID=2692869 RepID=UPI001682F3DE|nr:hypothetical protein [Trichocoleus sp. FACHB-262]MBD2121523.1 hypothetical protein [Trichocoleus sp. FACHB-262]
MQILVDTPTKLVIQVRDVEYSKPGRVINIVCLVISAIIFFYLINLAKGHLLISLLIALVGSSPIFFINNVWLGRQNKFFTFDQSLEKLVVERQNNFVLKATCVSGIFLIILFTLSPLSKTKYTNIADIVGILFITLILSATALVLFGFFSLLFHRLVTKLIRRQYLFSSKVRVGECWLCHINDVKVQCSTFVGSYGVVVEQCKIILSGALQVEIETDFDEACNKQLAQHIANRIKVFLAK